VSYRLKRISPGVDPFDRTYLVDLHEDVFGTSAPPIIPHEGVWFVVTDGPKYVAFGGMRYLPKMVNWAYLNRSGVLNAHRGRGLQKRLIRARERYARRVGIKVLVTDTSFNPASANSLIATGFRVYDPVEPWAFEHSIYWKKELA